MFDADQGVALGIAARCGRSVERDIDRARRGRIVRGIDPRTAIEHIRASAADQGIIAIAAVERVIARAAADQIVAVVAVKLVVAARPGQRIVECRARDPFDIGQGIAFGIAAMADAGGKVDIDRRARGGIVGLVKAGAAIEHVRARAAHQHVIPGSARQRVIAGPARKRVVAIAAGQAVIAAAAAKPVVIGRADDRLDPDQLVTGSIPGRADRAIERDHHARARGGIIDRVKPVTADQRVRSDAADQRVVARAAIQHLVAAAADQPVVIGRTDDMLDVLQHIARGIAADPCRAVEKDRDRAGRGRIIGGVEARSAIQRVGPGAAGQRVVAIAALDPVVARAAAQRIVVRRSDQMFDIADHIALGIAAAADRTVERDIDRRARTRIIHRVDARPAIDRVGTVATHDRVVAIAAQQHVAAFAAIDPVVAGAALDRVVAAAAGQAVVIGRSDQVLDIEDLIALGIAAKAQPAIEIGGNPAARLRIADRVGAIAAIEHIGARPGDQQVIARTARNRVGGRAAAQRVVVVRSDQHLDIGQLIARGIARGARGARQVDRHRACRMGICHRIGARAAIDLVRTGAALDRVVAVAAKQRVIARAAADQVIAVATVDPVIARRPGQRVIERGSDHALDVGQHIALGIAAGVGRAIEMHVHPVERSGIADRVETGAAIDDIAAGAADDQIVAIAAVQHIRATAADQRVIARTAVQRVVAVAAGQAVVEIRADDVLDVDQRIALGIAAGTGRSVEPDHHCRGRMRIVRGVDAGAAVERVGPGAAHQRVVAAAAVKLVAAAAGDQDIIARTADQRIGRRAARDRVVIGRALDHLDRDEHIARRVARRAASIQRQRHARARSRIVCGVDAAAAIQRIGPGPAGQRIVARAAVQRIVAGRTDQAVVVDRSDHRLDIGQQVALGGPARADHAVQPHRHRRVGLRIIRGVEPGAAIEQVGSGAADHRVVAIAAGDRVAAGAADQQVVARPAVQRIAAGAAGQGVVIGRPGQLLDRDQHIARGIAHRAGARHQRDRDRRGGIRIVRGIEAVAAIQRVGTAAPAEDVIPRAARQRIVARGTQQGVVVGRSDQVLDADQLVALGRAAVADRAVDRHIDPGGGAGIIDRVEPGAAIEHIGPGPAVQRIVAIAAQQRVIARAARKDVVARPARQRVIARTAGQMVVIGRPDHAFDADQGIALGIAAHADAAIERHRDRSGRSAVIDSVVAGAAIEHIGPGAAQDHVITRAAVDRFVARAAAQRIVVGRTDQHLDILQHIAQRIARGAGSAIKRDRDPGGRMRIVGGVGARAADQRVRAGAADQRVIARAAIQHIAAGAAHQGVVARPAFDGFGAGTAGQAVVKARSDQHLDIAELVALGIATVPG